jgi:hypothetical protein
VTSLDDLCAFIADAESREISQEQQSGSVNRLSSLVRNGRRSETPDGVSLEVEADPEDNVRKRIRYDCDYVPEFPVCELQQLKWNAKARTGPSNTGSS